MTYCDCLRCRKEMHGIVTHWVRETCEECGGESLMVSSRELLEERKIEREHREGLRHG